ncbi:MAG: hypothetical protein NTY37_03710 [Methanothrix sp.]|nr:hypothetical protein [Methanothrix sp.]
MAYLRVPVEDAPSGPRSPEGAHAGVRARAWGGVGVVCMKSGGLGGGRRGRALAWGIATGTETATAWQICL